MSLFEKYMQPHILRTKQMQLRREYPDVIAAYQMGLIIGQFEMTTRPRYTIGDRDVTTIMIELHKYDLIHYPGWLGGGGGGAGGSSSNGK